MTLLLFVVDLVGKESLTSKGRIIVTLAFAILTALTFSAAAGVMGIVDETADRGLSLPLTGVRCPASSLVSDGGNSLMCTTDLR